MINTELGEFMALINCPECGNKISDTANRCPRCGYALKSMSKKIAANKKKILRITICAIILIFTIIAARIFSRPNIKMEDFNIENGEFATILFLGIPTETDGDEWIYRDCDIEFYNIPVKQISYDISAGKYHLMFDGQYQDNLRNTIGKYCDYSDYVYIFFKYTYKELELSVDYDTDFCFISID